VFVEVKGSSRESAWAFRLATGTLANPNPVSIRGTISKEERETNLVQCLLGAHCNIRAQINELKVQPKMPMDAFPSREPFVLEAGDNT